MDKLQKAREEINAIDSEMAKLFERRMIAAELVAEHKRTTGMPIYDKAREDEVIRRNVEYIENPEIKGYYTKFLENTMSISRRYQERLLGKMKVAYSGVEGAFACSMVKKIYPYADRVPYPNFREAYDSVVDGECDCAVLPIENSTAGEVGNVLDMMFAGNLNICGVYNLFITQNLIGCKGASIDDVREVISHPQALAQSAAYIRSHGFLQREAENTALAAKFVAEQNDPTLAAIASEDTAELYGLKILEKNLNDKNINTTRFAVFTRTPTTYGGKDKHSILMFTVSNQAGSLGHAVNVIGKYGYNMRCLRSRPMKELMWKYYFYVELEGDLDCDDGRKMVSELNACCDKFKVIGSFKYTEEY